MPMVVSTHNDKQSQQRWTDSYRRYTTDAACGANNGAININDVTGGSAPYEYQSMAVDMVTLRTSPTWEQVRTL
jgi:hypothetical protein